MDICFPLLLELYPFNTPFFTHKRHFSISLCLLLPHPYRPGAEKQSTWMEPPPTALQHSSALPSHSGRPKDFLARACDCLPSSGCPPFDFLDLRLVPCYSQGLSCPRVPSSLWLPQSFACPILPCRPWPAAQSPAGTEWFVLCYSVPRPLWASWK